MCKAWISSGVTRRACGLINRGIEVRDTERQTELVFRRLEHAGVLDHALAQVALRVGWLGGHRRRGLAPGLGCRRSRARGPVCLRGRRLRRLGWLCRPRRGLDNGAALAWQTILADVLGPHP